MNYDPNLANLVGILVNGMITVFSVLFLVYFTSKLFISIVSKLNIQSKKKNTVDQEIREKVSELSNGKGSVIKYTKLS
jgi:Na+-transporting methylmalonyl-CoA/oxaloacetate decarboxylase gamma subunit|tara:strand:+ start:449 stop:682 length:234 start_codon:yes stop_codon:yes gene_type:complete